MRESQSFYCGVQCLVKKETSRGGPRSVRILLGRRYRAAGEGQWALPGGHVEWDETPLITARRELLEETGLVGVEAKLGATFFTYSTEIPYAHVPVLFEDVKGIPQLIPGERFSAIDYFRLDSLPRPMFEPSRLAIEALLGGSVRVETSTGSTVTR